MPSPARSYNYCYTINNPTELDSAAVSNMSALSRYHVMGKEKGENGTPHFQGYVVFKTLKSLEQVKKLLPRAHIEAAKGDAESNFNYCSKEGDYIESGTRPMSQKEKGRKGAEYWADVLSKAKAGDLESIDPKTRIQYNSALNNIAKMYAPMPPDAEDTTGHWFFGPSGTGKSRTAREENPGYYLKTCNKWWDGYQNEETVIIEDFDKKHGDSLCYFLKIWGDRYAFPAEIKGGKINIRPKKIIVTSNYRPEEIWYAAQDLDPILRRFKIKEFK